MEEQNITMVVSQVVLIPDLYNMTKEDSNWIMTSAFIIFTMQTGKFICDNNK